MKWLLLVASLLALGAPQLVSADGKVVCFYDSRSYYRHGTGKFEASDISGALQYCTHLVYGYARIDNTDYHVKALDDSLDSIGGHDNYHAVTNYKSQHLGLKVLLSVGGYADTEDTKKYLTMLENADSRANFITSTKSLLKQYGFDGLDLAWQFPQTKAVKDRGTIVNGLRTAWQGLKSGLRKAGTALGVTTSKDEKALQHRNGFSALVKELKDSFEHDGLLLTATMLPNINASLYVDVKKVGMHVDFINIMAFDYQTPYRQSDFADYPSAVYAKDGRPSNTSVDETFAWWLDNDIRGSKLVLGIPTFGRTWRLTAESSVTGVPPIQADGPGQIGGTTLAQGLLSYPEICAMSHSPNTRTSDHLLRRVTDTSNYKLGTYAFKLPEPDHEGLWVGYNDFDTVAYKAKYAKDNHFGGVAIFDITSDDFRGSCAGEKFTLTKVAKARLTL